MHGVGQTLDGKKVGVPQFVGDHLPKMVIVEVRP